MKSDHGDWPAEWCAAGCHHSAAEEPAKRLSQDLPRDGVDRLQQPDATLEQLDVRGVQAREAVEQ